MIWILALSLIFTALLLMKRNVWDKILALSSLGVKVSVLIILYSWILKTGFLIDVGVMYLMLSGAGIILILFMMLRSGLE